MVFTLKRRSRHKSIITTISAVILFDDILPIGRLTIQAEWRYLTQPQVDRAWSELEWVGDPENLHPNIIELVDAGTNEQWMRPDEQFTARAWAYNVIHITNSLDATYTFHLDGDQQGSEGGDSHFEARIVVMDAGVPLYSDLTMTHAFDGEGAVTVSSSTTDLYLVVASVPPIFYGNQHFGYAIKIVRD
jgi:hypothetical protein